jgi:hypothetical protein
MVLSTLLLLRLNPAWDQVPALMSLMGHDYDERTYRRDLVAFDDILKKDPIMNPRERWAIATPSGEMCPRKSTDTSSPAVRGTAETPRVRGTRRTRESTRSFASSSKSCAPTKGCYRVPRSCLGSVHDVRLYKEPWLAPAGHAAKKSPFPHGRGERFLADLATSASITSSLPKRNHGQKTSQKSRRTSTSVTPSSDHGLNVSFPDSTSFALSGRRTMTSSTWRRCSACC